MPELPEVETIKRDLQKRIVGKNIKEAFVYDARVLKNISTKDFKKYLKGSTIENVSRIGKAIVLHLDRKTNVFIQPRMTGHLIYSKKLKKGANLKETKFSFHLSGNGFLHYNDQRTLGTVLIIKNLNEINYVKTIGPEPLTKDFSAGWLKTHLKKRQSPIKPLLMNQHFVAGIGNIYASEILFNAHIHPQKSAKQLKSFEVEALHKATKEVLEEAINYRGSSMRNYRDTSGKKGEYFNRIKVYARDNQPCIICKSPIKKIVQSGRSTFYCEKCQR